MHSEAQLLLQHHIALVERREQPGEIAEMERERESRFKAYHPTSGLDSLISRGHNTAFSPLKNTAF